MLGESLLNCLVHRQERLACAPVHFADELTTECVDDTGDGRSSTLAYEVKVHHALDSLWLHTTVQLLAFGLTDGGVRVGLLDKASCLVVEQSMAHGAHCSRGGLEAYNVLVGIVGLLRSQAAVCTGGFGRERGR